MSYSHTQYTKSVVTDTAITAAANVGAAQHFAVKTILRRVTATVTVALTTAAAVLTIYRRVTPDSDTGRVAIGTLTIPVSSAIGTVWVLESINDTDRKIAIGEEIIVASDGGPGAGSANIDLLVEPSWDTAENEGATVVTS